MRYVALAIVFVSCVAATPHIVEIGPTFRDPLGGIAIAADGTIWAAECNGAVRVRRDGSFTEYRRSDDGNPDCSIFGGPGIVRGPDGLVWSDGNDRLLHYIGGAVRPYFPHFAHVLERNVYGIGGLSSTAQTLYASGGFENPGIAAIDANGTESLLAANVQAGGIAASARALWLVEIDSEHSKVARWNDGHLTVVGHTVAGCCPVFSMAASSNGSLIAGTAPREAGDANRLLRVGPDGSLKVLIDVKRGGSFESTIAGIALGADGIIWFAEPSANRLAKLDAGGKLTEYRDGIPRGASPYGVALDSDGSVWFSDVTQNTIEHLTTDGRVRIYGNGLSPINTPGGPVVTADGSLWFLETLSWHPRIARIGRDGVLNEYPLNMYVNGALQPFGKGIGFIGTHRDGAGRDAYEFDADGTLHRIDARGCLITWLNFACFRDHLRHDRIGYPGAFGNSAVLGPDGNLWFTDAEDSQIGRISRSGKLTIFTRGLTRFHSGPQYITVGPDGALWFTEIRDRIGRITLDGRITEFSRGIPFRSFVGGIVAGRDGNLWFTLYHGNELARITPAGVVTRFRKGIYPSRGNDSTCPDSVPFVDAKGRIWFNEPQGGRIAQATLY